MKRRPPHAESLPEPVFDWRREKSRFWFLLPPLLLSSVALAVLSILFTVSEPDLPHPPSASRQLIQLTADNPDARLALSRAEDISSLILTDPAETTQPAALPPFRPSFQGVTLNLKPLGSRAPAAPLPRLFQPQDLTIPPIPSRAPPASVPPPGTPPQLQAHLAGPLAARGWLHPPNLTSLRPLDAPRLSFQIQADATGRILLALPESANAESAELLQTLHDRLRAARLSPQSQAADSWSRITFSWQP
ncbi:MAG: hypothetical protein KDK99_17140 [Verrucomicrobiales bacterium]|nr:hypothetical protein [Verrucomicrobiales bacterium]